MVERTCPACQGACEVIADPCPTCRGEGRVDRRKSLTVTIPPGVDEGTRIRLSGEGESSARGAAPGALYIFLPMDRHQLFDSEGTTLFTRATLRLTLHALVATSVIPGLYSDTHDIPPPAGLKSTIHHRRRAIAN